MFLLSDADDTTSRPSSSIPSGFTQLVAALPQVINVSVDHDSAADDGVLPSERDHGVSDVKLGTAPLGSHVPEVSHVSLSLPVLRSSVLTLVRIEVRPGTGAAVGVVSELEISGVILGHQGRAPATEDVLLPPSSSCLTYQRIGLTT